MSAHAWRARRRGAAAFALAGGLAVGAAIAGCGEPASPAHPRLWTLFDLAGLATGGGGDRALAADGGVPGGIPVSHFVTSDSGGVSLTLSGAWTASVRAAYVTTELWSGVAQVWVQPMYVPVTGFNADGMPQMSAGPPIFSVGPRSAFYSPYWQQIFFVAPGGAAGAFTSERQVIDSGVALHAAGAAIRSLAPAGSIGQPVDDTPGAGHEVLGPVMQAKGWLDGQPIDFLQLGTSTFRWGADRVVEELPLFIFTMRGPDGNVRRIDGVQAVGGTGPIGSGAPPDVSGGQPRYGALWRAYTVTVPAGARVFAPPQFKAIADAVGQSGIPLATTLGPDVLAASADEVQQWAGRIAMNPTCFDTLAHLDPANGADTCVWLDSQAAIEREIDGEWIRRSDLLLTCPFVSYQDVAVSL